MFHPNLRNPSISLPAYSPIPRFDLGVDYSDDEVRADKNKLGYVAIPICYEWGRRGSGAMFSLVSGMGGPNTAANVVTSGLFFALVQGGLFKIDFINKAEIVIYLYLQLLCQRAKKNSRDEVPQIFREKKTKKIGIRSQDLEDSFEKFIKA
ncbi:hypothetical protein AgCh_001710 [Apium graveolens]